jgi:hypothetical protein
MTGGVVHLLDALPPVSVGTGITGQGDSVYTLPPAALLWPAIKPGLAHVDLCAFALLPAAMRLRRVLLVFEV